MAEVCANSEDSDQTPHSAASDLGLHCLPNTLLGVSRLQWIKEYIYIGELRSCSLGLRYLLLRYLFALRLSAVVQK